MCQGQSDYLLGYSYWGDCMRTACPQQLEFRYSLVSKSSWCHISMKIGIYNIEACSRLVVGEGEFGAPAKLRAPKWLKLPAGASFGFGGKLVSFHPSPSTLGAPSCTSEVYVHNLVTEHNLVSRSTNFQAAIQNGEKTSMRALCDKMSQDSESKDDRETWGFLKVMFEEEGTARTKLLAHLGFSVPNEGSENVFDDLGKKLMHTVSLDEQTTYKSELMEGEKGSAVTIDNGEDFFNNPQLSGDSLVTEETDTSNGKQVPVVPEEHLESSDSSFDDNIQHALVVGGYEGAVLQCISANRMADALVIAHVGGPSLWESTRDLYLKKSHLPYLQIVSAMVSNDLVSLVNTRSLNLWKETLALLCTFAERDEWTSLCDTLATRLMTVVDTLAATLCYICAGNIDRTVEIWSCNLKAEQEGKTYVDLLQDLMEKTIVLAFATGHKRFSASLSKLIENYAELLASQGLLPTAMEYLKLLGSDESSHELAILHDRIALSAEESETKSYPYESSIQEANSMYGAEQSSFGRVDSSQHYYQDKLQPQQNQNISGSPYSQGYQQPFGSSYGGYQPTQQKQQFQEYINPVPLQMVQSPQMFLPSLAPQVPQPSYAPSLASTQPAVKPFVPATPPTLRNVEQYQQPTLGAQLYPGVASPAYKSGPPGLGSSQAATVPGNRFAQVMAPNPAPRSFMPVTTPGLVPRPGESPVQPSSPTQPSQVRAPVAPPAPPPTVQTVDTSNVPAELRPVVTTLTRLFNETSEALGGSHANPSKKWEIEDNSRRIGSLFVKLNSGDMSPNAASKLCQLCQALDSGDFVGALQIQVQLTTSDWEECSYWLGPVKRMIKTRQTVRLN